MSMRQKFNDVLDVLATFGQVDGEAGKAWVIDQVLRVLRDCLLDENMVYSENAQYRAWVDRYRDDGRYSWNIGVPTHLER